MENFYNIPLYNLPSDGDADGHLLTLTDSQIDVSAIQQGIEQNKLVLVRPNSFDEASNVFGKLVDHYGLRNSYDMQMQFVIHLMESRKSVGSSAVTVNERGPLEIIQPHSEGDSESPLDLFGLYCEKNAQSGGENVFSLINQSADHSKLSAKQKVIIGEGLSESDIFELREEHLDAREILPACDNIHKILKQTSKGKLAIRTVPVSPMKSVISGEDLTTYWDNVTVHDHAFHRHHYELLRHLGILHEKDTNDYKDYLHIENDSDWAPIDTDSGDLFSTAQLFSAHVVYKTQPHDFVIFNNRIWTHAVNNWPEGQQRDLSAMYA